MRVGFYNQMFGLNGRSFWASLIGHWAVHFQADVNRVWERTDLKDTIRIVKKAKADIFGVIEILEGQEDEIVRGLKKLGYRYFYFGKGHKTKCSGLHVVELIASKIKGKQLNYKEWPVENHLGGGGGMVVCYFPKLKLNVVHIHLGLPGKKFFFEQIKHTQKVLKKLKGRVVLMGDFNECCYNVKSYFPELELVTGGMKTCSLTPILRWFYNKDCDHVLIRGLKFIRCGFLEGKSDHKLVYVDLE